MLLDFELLTTQLETITNLKPIPHRKFLENYIKAFFLPYQDLDKWIVDHAEYSLSQTSALLNFGSSPKKRLLSSILDNS
jgi:hypothetical protein